MTRKPDDWMPLRVRKYLGDTMHLTRDQHGAYLLLLMAYWMRGGPLPANDNELAAIIRASKSEWARLKIVLAPFFEVADGKWVQKRAEEELAKAKRLTEAKADSGSRGGRSKWGSSLDLQNQDNRSQRLSAARKIATHTALEWEVMVEVFGTSCVRCGALGRPVKDHIIPIYKGGSDGLDNIQPLCQSCNSAKGPEATDHRNNALHNWKELLAKCLANAKQTPAPLPSNLVPVSEEAKASSGGAAAKLVLVADKPDWWPLRDRYGRVLGEVTDKLLFDVGKAVLGGGAGGQITKLKKYHPYRHDWRAAVELLLRADEASDPRSWFAAALHKASVDEPVMPMHEAYPEAEYRL